MSSFYEEDLAYIHQAGFSAHARNAGETVFARLQDAGIDSGLVVDLGCGSGIWAAMLVGAGFDVLGFDISAAMIRLARRNAPAAEFRCASISEAHIPSCVAVTAFGEVFNYRSDVLSLPVLFSRIARSLCSGGLFVFDVLVGSGEPLMQYRSWQSGDDWAVLTEVHEQPADRRLERHIISFRAEGAWYRRTEEHHLLHVWHPDDVEAALLSAGFKFSSADRYGTYQLAERRLAYFARKESP